MTPSVSGEQNVTHKKKAPANKKKHKKKHKSKKHHKKHHARKHVKKG